MPALKIDGLCKSFGNKKVIDGLSFEVKENRILGFLGKNGAGKTTTMKMILGFLSSDSGEIQVFGERVRYGVSGTNKDIGYLPDVPEFYGYMRPTEYLELCGRITGLSKAEITQRSRELLTLVGLENDNRRIGGFSRGMKQRLGIAQALLNRPRLLICDEPTSALDPVGRREVLDILLKLRGKTTVIFSTHILGDAERVCDDIVIINGGREVLKGNLNELKEERADKGITVDFKSSEEMEVFLKNSSLENMECHEGNNRISIQVMTDKENMGKKLMEEFLRLSIFPQSMRVEEPSLENIFMEVVER